MYERGKRVQSARRSSAEGPGPKRSSTLPPTLLQSDLEYTFKPQLVTSAARGEPPRSSVAVFDRLAPTPEALRAKASARETQREDREMSGATFAPQRQTLTSEAHGHWMREHATAQHCAVNPMGLLEEPVVEGADTKSRAL